MRMRAIGAGALACLWAAGPAHASEGTPAEAPGRIVLPVAAGFLPKVGDLRVGDEGIGSVYALGGEAPVRFEIVSGRLPDGLWLASDGRLVGPVTGPGTFSATVRVGDAAGQSADVPLDLVVLPGAAAR